MPRKMKWESFEVVRVKLNPEQAVLACCNATSKTAVNANLGTQCYVTFCFFPAITGTSS